MRPFNLEKALAGEPVILRNGARAYVRHHETELQVKYPLCGFVEGETSEPWLIVWKQSGHFRASLKEHSHDIVGMYPKLKMPSWFWDMVHTEIKAVAKDANGSWYGYASKPEIFGTRWRARATDYWKVSSEGIRHNIFPNCNWEDSLILRPENT